MKCYIFIVFLTGILFVFNGVAAQSLSSELVPLFNSMEAELMQFRIGGAEKIYEKAREMAPEHPVVLWQAARIAIQKKEELHAEADLAKAKKLREEYGELCHHSADKCLKVAPDNPECHLAKGTCYATQATTWGVSVRSLLIIDDMEREWKTARKLKSDYSWGGYCITSDLVDFFLGMFYRIIPESWFLKLLTGVKGDKKKSYELLRSVVPGKLDYDVFLIAEFASSAICYGQISKRQEITAEGMEWLKVALSKREVTEVQKRDKKIVQYLIDHPEMACKYRREKFEDTSNLDGVVPKN